MEYNQYERCEATITWIFKSVGKELSLSVFFYQF